MKKITYTLLLLLTSWCTMAQQSKLDKLNNAYNIAENDTIRLGILLDLIDTYAQYNLDTALTIGFEAEKIAKNIGDTVELAVVEYELASLLRSSGRLSYAMTYAKKALGKEEAFANKQNISRAYAILGSIYFEQSNFVDALKNYLQALSIYEELEQKEGIASIYNNLGFLYKEKGSTEVALKYYNKSLAINQAINDSLGLAHSYNNLGMVYRSRRDYRSAEDYFFKSIAINQKLGNNEALAGNLLNIGITYNMQGLFDDALNVLAQSLEINKAIGNIARQSQNYNILSSTYLRMGVPYKSLQYAKEAFEISKKTGQLSSMQIAAETQYKTYKQMGNYADALRQFEISQSLKDSLQSVQQYEDMANLRNNYELEKQQLAIESINKDRIIQKDQLEVQAIQRNVLVVVLTFLAIIVYILVKNNHRKQKNNNTLTQKHSEIEMKNAELARLNQEIVNQNSAISIQKNNLEELNHIKNNLFTIVSHDFRSPLKSIQGFLNLLSLGALTNEEMHKILEDLKVKVDMTTDFLENLLTWARNQMYKIESKPQPISLKKIADGNIELLTPVAEKKGVKLLANIDENIEGFADANMINLVVRNLVVNAIKFTDQGDIIKLSAKRDGSRGVFTVEDTGIGIDEAIITKLFNLETYSTTGTANEKGTGLGLILCKEFVEKNKGAIWAESKVGQGSKFSFSIPLTPKKQDVAIPA